MASRDNYGTREHFCILPERAAAALHTAGFNTSRRISHGGGVHVYMGNGGQKIFGDTARMTLANLGM